MLNLQQTAEQAIPVYFNEKDFNEFILPHLWQGKRGPQPKIPLYTELRQVLCINPVNNAQSFASRSIQTLPLHFAHSLHGRSVENASGRKGTKPRARNPLHSGLA